MIPYLTFAVGQGPISHKGGLVTSDADTSQTESQNVQDEGEREEAAEEKLRMKFHLHL